MRDVILHTVTGKFSLDRLICTAGSIALRITALHHETIYDTPESQSVIESVLCKLHEVCHCDRSCVCIQFYLDASIILDIDPCMMDSCQFLAGIQGRLSICTIAESVCLCFFLAYRHLCHFFI